MSDTDSEIKVVPALCRVQIRVERWANRAADRSGVLINPVHLAPVNRALDECIRFMESRTIPTLRPNERLISTCQIETWLFPVNRELREAEMPTVAGMTYMLVRGKVFDLWRGTLLTLADQWEANVREAEQRLGTHFRQADFPIAADLHKHFIAWGEYDGEKDITSRAILGTYSTFEPPPPPPRDPLLSMFEAFDYTRELEALYELRRSGKLTEQEFRDRFEELNSKYPCDGTWGKS